MLRGKAARTGDRLNPIQSPTVWVVNSNVKSQGCLRASSIVTSPIVARGNVIPGSNGFRRLTPTGHFINRELLVWSRYYADNAISSNLLPRLPAVPHTVRVIRLPARPVGLRCPARLSDS